jgi:hypothetical protein
MKLGRKLSHVGEPVGNAGHRVAILGKPGDITAVLGSGPPATAVNPDNQAGSLRLRRQVEIKLQTVSIDTGKLDVLDDRARFLGSGAVEREE